jgi:hypothetical protein
MAKTSAKKFTGALAKPIKLPPIPLVHAAHPETEEAMAFYASRSNETERQRLMKLATLASHYGAECKDIFDLNPLMLVGVLYRLALDCVPGFQTTDSQPKVGRPKGHDAMIWLSMVDHIKAAGHAKTDIEAAAIVAECFDPTLGTNAKRPDRAERARTIANYVSSMRTSLKRKAAGKVH